MVVRPSLWHTTGDLQGATHFPPEATASLPVAWPALTHLGGLCPCHCLLEAPGLRGAPKAWLEALPRALGLCSHFRTTCCL